LLLLAFSHAALGSAFYYGLFGHDLAAEWRAIRHAAAHPRDTMRCGLQFSA